jgi:putative heme iron utilization protein
MKAGLISKKGRVLKSRPINCVDVDGNRCTAFLDKADPERVLFVLHDKNGQVKRADKMTLQKVLF